MLYSAQIDAMQTPTINLLGNTYASNGYVQK